MMTSSDSADLLEPPADSTAGGAPLAAGAHSPGHALPEEPLVTIEPSDSRSPLNLRDVWAYRELLYFLVWRDVKVRYKQTALGAAWAVLQPLFMMAVFTLFFGRLAGLPSDGVPYPLFAYAGLLPWTFFSNAVTTGSNSLVGNSHLITKVYFPRVLIPTAAVVAGLVDLGFAFLLLAPLMAYYGVAGGWSLLLLPAFVALVVLLALGCATWLAALNVRFRDVRFVVPFLLQVWMFASPVIYPASFVPERWRWVLALNPLTGIIEGFRWSLFGAPARPDWAALGGATTATLALLLYAAYAFRRVERSFADLV